MSAWILVASAVLAALLDPFAFFAPTVRLETRERDTLAAGRAVARTTPAPDGHVGIFGAVEAGIDADRLVRWMHDIAALKRSPTVKEIGRFSPEPQLADLAGLTLDAEDAKEIAGCRVARCGIKLEPAEIEAIRRAMTGTRSHTDERVQRAFREVVLGRARRYLVSGREGAPPPEFLRQRWPDMVRDLVEFPHRSVPDAESFLYWAKDHYAGKPIVSVTHVTIVRSARQGEPEVLVVGRQVFGTHYVDGAWSVTALVRGDRSAYLAYVNQTAIDLLDSWYGGLIRRVVSRRLREEAVDVLEGLRRRLEGGDPPARSGA